MTTVQKYLLIFIAILVLDFDLTAIVYGNKLVSLIGLLILFLMILLFCLALVIAGRDD